jgi:enoyl-CoA hydratase/carnithine racemase
MTGRRVEIDEAASLGMVDLCCPSGGLDQAVADTIAAFGTIHRDAIQLARQLFDESFEIAYEDFLGCFLSAQHRTIQSDGFKELIRRAHEQGTPRPTD